MSINGVKVITIDEFYTVELARNNPNVLFVFGDNTQRWGKGGQAIIRDEPNVYGIATKVSPGTTDKDYFSDIEDHFHIVFTEAFGLLNLLCDESHSYTHVAFPSSGIGTGLAKMSEKCPKLFNVLNDILKTTFGITNGEQKL